MLKRGVRLPNYTRNLLKFPMKMKYVGSRGGFERTSKSATKRRVAKFDPRAMIGTIYNGDYQTLLPTKYRSSGPHGFREEDKFSFSQCKSMGSICCHGNHNFDTTGFFLSLVISFLDRFGRSRVSRVSFWSR